MSRKASLILTLTAWLFATGSHWDIVQTFAWGKMFATYAQSMSYTDAAKLTFSGTILCNVCEIVSDAKQGDSSGQPGPASSGTQKILLALNPANSIILQRPDLERWPEHQDRVPQPRGQPAGPPSSRLARISSGPSRARSPLDRRPYSVRTRRADSLTLNPTYLCLFLSFEPFPPSLHSRSLLLSRYLPLLAPTATLPSA